MLIEFIKSDQISSKTSGQNASRFYLFLFCFFFIIQKEQFVLNRIAIISRKSFEFKFFI